MLESFSGLGDSNASIDTPQIASGLLSTPRPAHPLVHLHRMVEHTCAETGGSLPAEDGNCGSRLIRAALLQLLYGFACDEQLMEHLRYNALYRWFVGLADGEPAWDAGDYARALNRLRHSETGGPLFRGVLLQAHAYAALTPGRFRVDAELLECWTPAAGDANCGRMGAGCADPSLARLQRARSIIERRIADPSLGPDQVAAEMYMSRRALYLLFEKHGMTPTRSIREIRLDSCRRMLRDARHRHRKITDIAMEFGFEDAGSFSRQFKSRYGFSPREARVNSASMREGTNRAVPHVASDERRCAL